MAKCGGALLVSTRIVHNSKLKAYYDRHDMYVRGGGGHVGASIVHLTEKLGTFAHAFNHDKDNTVNAVAEILIVTLQILNNLKQPASGILKEKLIIMEQEQKAGGKPV